MYERARVTKKPPNKGRVLVGLSGGVDSAVSAWLLKKEGYDVQGVVLRLWEEEEDRTRPWTERTCCHVPMVEYLCERILGIPLEIHESAEEFQERVVVPFRSGYAAGTTPNPCTTCNAEIKIRTLLRIAEKKGIPTIATGHYASWAFSEDFRRWGLRMSRDIAKDQSYFLARTGGITPENFLLPLGERTKTEVRTMAEEAGFPVSGMLENQEACFVSEKRIADFLRGPERKDEPGEWKALTSEGESLGSLRTGVGLTRGQRRGHGIAGGERLYVLSVDPLKKEVLMGRREDLLSGRFAISHPLGIVKDTLPEFPSSFFVRFRSTMPPVPCRPHPEDPLAFQLEIPHDGIVPGQVAAFYDRSRILVGSGLLI
ncbi:MAG: tRNA 2-thiouridine(34) synthase MnmA [Nitrospirae bacterium]|nr:tRNA 2-thiouridine(34) synthase MnmA [Nitrospirota bacterium]